MSNPVGAALDWFGNALGTIVDTIGGLPVISNVVDIGAALAKFTGLEDLASSIIDGPLKDFANTTLGKYLLNVIAAGLSTGLLYLGGIGAFEPICTFLSIAVYAVPGLAAGDDWGSAWSQGFIWRVNTFVKYVSLNSINLDSLGVSQEYINEAIAAGETIASVAAYAYGAQLQAVMQLLQSQQSGTSTLELNAGQLALMTGARVDICQLALDLLNGTNIAAGCTYDAQTGNISGSCNTAAISAALTGTS